MTFKFYVLLISSYLLAFSINLIPSLKHPDSHLTFINLLAASLLLLTFLAGIKSILFNDKCYKRAKGILMAGFLSGLLVFGIKMLEETVMNNMALDALASIQYPLYLLFITPFFGMNYLLDLGYGTFSLLVSIVYLLMFAAVIAIKRYYRK